MSDFGHQHDKRDHNAWKKMSEWSHSVPDYELDALWDEDIWSTNLPPVETGAQKFGKFLVATLGLFIGIALVSVVFYQLVLALGFTDITFREAVIATVCVAFIRYADAGVMKQLR